MHVKPESLAFIRAYLVLYTCIYYLTRVRNTIIYRNRCGASTKTQWRTQKWNSFFVFWFLRISWKHWMIFGKIQILIKLCLSTSKTKMKNVPEASTGNVTLPHILLSNYLLHVTDCLFNYKDDLEDNIDTGVFISQRMQILCNMEFST